MGAFEYTALDPQGRERKGLIEGDTPKHVRQLLRDKQLLPMDIQETAAQEQKQSRRRRFMRRGLSSLDLAMLTRQLATLLRSGLPLEETLQAVAEQTEKPRVQRIVLGVRSKVVEGHPLADGLRDFPAAFPEIYRATVSAGEQSGKLDQVLERLSDYTESRQVMGQQVSNALVYPIVLLVLSFGIVSFLLAYVVPQVVAVFQSSNQELPVATRILIGMSDFIRHYWFYGLIALGALVWAFMRWLRAPEARLRFHRFLLRLPVAGRLIRGLNTGRFSRTFSILTASAVPVLEALRISAEVVTNMPMKQAVEEAALRVREGAPIGRSLAARKLFPPMMIHLISSGESSGELEKMLERAATNQEREMDGLLSNMTNLLGPLMVVFMGGIVMFIVIALLLPIFQLNDLVK
ncbi:MAG TPA: type II secretion system inner membrane protein GspF [Steroidobacteraceae bacterium]|jgi:general secretion pathway protein F|nr:type II secretion system inner membrane protein GspF [Steroidobacteraceae bacterium]